MLQPGTAVRLIANLRPDWTIGTMQIGDIAIIYKSEDYCYNFASHPMSWYHHSRFEEVNLDTLSKLEKVIYNLE